MNAILSDTILAGGPDDFMTVRHVRLAGEPGDMGAALADIAVGQLGCTKVPWSDPEATRQQRNWLNEQWPLHAARSRGVSRHLELPQDDTVDPSFLYYDWAVPGCSNVCWPGAITEDGHTILSRNYDFTTGTVFELMGQPSPPEARPATCAPFLLETHPDGPGYATLLMTSYELLGSALDGVNSQGLGMALMATVEQLRAPGATPPSRRNQPGINEIQLVRYVLETAATAAEARTLLSSARHYTQFVPCHYLIADASGDHFVWSAIDGYRLDGHPERPLCATNHLDGKPLADIPQRDESAARLARLQAATERELRQGLVDRAGIRRAAEHVAATLPPGEGQYTSASPARTLWHAFYDLHDKSVTLDFYLGDAPDGSIRRSVPRTVWLG